jgi:hypothetical protein
LSDYQHFKKDSMSLVMKIYINLANSKTRYEFKYGKITRKARSYVCFILPCTPYTIEIL